MNLTPEDKHLLKEIVDTSVRNINRLFPFELKCKVGVSKLGFSNPCWSAEYKRYPKKEILLRWDLLPNSSYCIFLLVHEIGHYIHDTWFKAKNFQLQGYSNYNHLEQFANTFTDLVFGVENEDTRKLYYLLLERVCNFKCR